MSRDPALFWISIYTFTYRKVKHALGTLPIEVRFLLSLKKCTLKENVYAASI